VVKFIFNYSIEIMLAVGVFTFFACHYIDKFFGNSWSRQEKKNRLI
jgi:hypothetical protein